MKSTSGWILSHFYCKEMGFFYLKKEEKKIVSTLPSLERHKAKIQLCANGWIKNFVQYTGQSLKIKTVKMWTRMFTPYDLKLWLHSYRVHFVFFPSLSDPLLLACTIDVVYGWSYGPFVILLIGVCIRPLEWLGNSMVLHGSIALPSCVRLSTCDELDSSVHSYQRAGKPSAQREIRDCRYDKKPSETNLLSGSVHLLKDSMSSSTWTKGPCSETTTDKRPWILLGKPCCLHLSNSLFVNVSLMVLSCCCCCYSRWST